MAGSESTLLEQAAAPTWERIDRDREAAANVWVERILSCARSNLESHSEFGLFSPARRPRGSRARLAWSPRYHRWAYFFREAENFEVIPPALDQEPFREALEVARVANLTAEE